MFSPSKNWHSNINYIRRFFIYIESRLKGLSYQSNVSNSECKLGMSDMFYDDVVIFQTKVNEWGMFHFSKSIELGKLYTKSKIKVPRNVRREFKKRKLQPRGQRMRMRTVTPMMMMTTNQCTATALDPRRQPLPQQPNLYLLYLRLDLYLLYLHLDLYLLDLHLDLYLLYLHLLHLHLDLYLLHLRLFWPRKKLSRPEHLQRMQNVLRRLWICRKIAC